MSSDPLERLLGELLGAWSRQRTRLSPHGEAVTSPNWAKWWAMPRRVLAVSIGALVLCASAAAGVVVASDRSAPLSGPLPAQLLGSRYSLTVTRDSTAGSGTWCISLMGTHTRIALFAHDQRCVRPGKKPLIMRGGLAVMSPHTGKVTGSLLYAIVRKDVPALREPDGHTVTPIADKNLPAGWRAAIVTQVDPSYKCDVPVTLTPVDARGHALIHAR